MTLPSTTASDPGIYVDAAETPERGVPRSEVLLWKIIKEADPAEYVERIGAAMQRGKFEASKALIFPLMHSMDKRLPGLPHKSESAPEMTRDERICAWFAACKTLGADPLQSLTRLAEHASGGFVRLMQMKAWTCLQWWQAQGAEMHFQGPHALQGRPVNFATLAFASGQLGAMQQLLPNAHLLHVDQLWHVVWSKPCAERSLDLLRHLWSAGEPPKDALVGLASARINLKNASQLLAAAQKLVEAGVDVRDRAPGMPPALTQALWKMQSPASAQLIDFLLAHGADPLEKFIPPVSEQTPNPVETTPLEVALDRWMTLPVRSHLRECLIQSFERMAQHCDRTRFAEVFPKARRDEVLGKFRGQPDVVPSPMAYGPQATWEAGPEATRLEALWLDMEVPALDQGNGAKRPRF